MSRAQDRYVESTGTPRWSAACRCPMHAFTLLICAMLGFPWAKALVGTAQQVAIYFCTDKAAVDILAAEARQLGLSVHLSPCKLSQVQSVHACLQSLLGMHAAIKQALLKYPDAFGNLEVRSVVPVCCSIKCKPTPALLVWVYMEPFTATWALLCMFPQCDVPGNPCFCELIIGVTSSIQLPACTIQMQCGNRRYA